MLFFAEWITGSIEGKDLLAVEQRIDAVTVDEGRSQQHAHRALKLRVGDAVMMLDTLGDPLLAGRDIEDEQPDGDGSGHRHQDDGKVFESQRAILVVFGRVDGWTDAAASRATRVAARPGAQTAAKLMRFECRCGSGEGNRLCARSMRSLRGRAHRD